jgi:hypothetical protein
VRVVEVSAPEGKGSEIVQLALAAGIREVSVHQERSYHADRALGFGLIEREWRLLARAVVALVVAVGLLVATGAVVGLAMDAPIRFQDFGHLLPGLLVSLAVGIASSLATTDAAGRRELIGLAVASQIALVPVWLGMRLVFGAAAGDEVPPSERLLGFAVNAGTIVGIGTVTYLLCCAKSGRRTSQRTSCFAIDSSREPSH